MVFWVWSNVSTCRILKSNEWNIFRNPQVLVVWRRTPTESVDLDRTMWLSQVGLSPESRGPGGGLTDWLTDANIQHYPMMSQLSGQCQGQVELRVLSTGWLCRADHQEKNRPVPPKDLPSPSWQSFSGTGLGVIRIGFWSCQVWYLKNPPSITS